MTMTARSLLALGALAAAGCATTGAGSNVPALPLQDVAGRTQYLTDFVGNGKVVVMSFWATWCQPCRQELGVLEKLYQKHKEEGLEVLAINSDGADTQSSVRSFAAQQRWSFPVLLDPDTRVAALYNPRKAMPMMHIFDRSGKLVYSHSTFQPGEAAALKAKVLEILRGGGDSAAE
jgi:peroxiredoxin